MLGKKKIMAIVAVVAIIISVCAVGVWYFMQPKAGMKIVIESIEEGENGLEVNILVMPSDSGEGTLKIMYDSLEMHSRSINIVNGRCTPVVPYNEFVTDNGNYTINVTFKDKSDEETHTITAVIKDIYISFKEKYDTQPIVDVSVWPSGLPGTNVKVTIKKQDGSVLPGADNTTLDCVEIEGKVSHYEKGLPYTHSGYYTIYATLTNPVKSDSNYLVVGKYLENETGWKLWLMNLPPDVQSPPDNTTNLASNDSYLGQGKEGWINFDATGLATDYDGDIIMYAWNFGYNKTLGRPANPKNNETNDFAIGIKVSYQYDKVGSYTVTLSAMDNEHFSNNANCTVTVRERPIGF